MDGGFYAPVARGSATLSRKFHKQQGDANFLGIPRGQGSASAEDLPRTE